MATVIPKTTSQVSTDIHRNKHTNSTTDDNNMTMKRSHTNKGRCKIQLIKMSVVMIDN
jgi:hypothetical protein